MNSQTGPRYTLNRRNFLRGATLAAGAAAVGSPLLAACGGGTVDSAAVIATQVPLPDYVSALRVTPDLVGDANGVQDGFLKAITEYYPSVDGKPGAGGEARVFVNTYSPPPPPVSENSWWQAVNERVGTDLKVEVVPTADYPAKFGSVMAGNDIPDLVQIPVWMNLPRLPELFANRFADLSDHLSGANVRKYPNLAGIPTYSWVNSRIKGRIHGVPLPRPLFGSPMLMRADLLEQLGAGQPTTAAEFEALCQEITDPGAGRWALGSQKDYCYNIGTFAQMFGAPRNWRQESDGRLTRDYETPEYVEAIEFARKLNAAGHFHPDSSSTNASQVKELFAGGRVLMAADGLAAWLGFYDTYSASVPGIKVDAMLPFAHDGGDSAQFYFDVGAYSLTAIKQGEPARVEEMLRILNYFAAPYGSAEHHLNGTGVEGVDHTRNADGTVELTERGKSERGVSFSYIAGGAPVMSSGEYPDWVRQQYEWEQKVTPLGVRDPTVGLYSDTASRVNSQLQKAMQDTLINIISGRGAVSDFPAAVETWRSGGGEKMRQEYQEALE